MSGELSYANTKLAWCEKSPKLLGIKMILNPSFAKFQEILESRDPESLIVGNSKISWN